MRGQVPTDKDRINCLLAHLRKIEAYVSNHNTNNYLHFYNTLISLGVKPASVNKSIFDYEKCFNKTIIIHRLSHHPSYRETFKKHILLEVQSLIYEIEKM